MWKSYCCSCYYQSNQAKAEEYNDYQQVYQRKFKEKKDSYQQLKLLQEYSGCKKCESKEVDAYHLYNENKLICQPCLMKKENGSSSPISFLEQGRWYKRYWKIDLSEWLENYGCLPVNAECARKWLKDKGHLGSCDCLEVEVKETYELFANSLKENEKKLKECQCETSPKIRVDSDYYAWCESCEVGIPTASKKRVIKNRNDPRFWGLKVKERILCGECLEKVKEKMPVRKKYLFNEYVKRECWK